MGILRRTNPNEERRYKGLIRRARGFKSKEEQQIYNAKYKEIYDTARKESLEKKAEMKARAKATPKPLVSGFKGMGSFKYTPKPILSQTKAHPFGQSNIAKAMKPQPMMRVSPSGSVTYYGKPKQNKPKGSQIKSPFTQNPKSGIGSMFSVPKQPQRPAGKKRGLFDDIDNLLEGI